MSAKVLFIAPIYNQYPAVIASLIMQRHQDWQLLLIHDGPPEINVRDMVKAVSCNDPRVVYMERIIRMGDWGHHNRKWLLEKVKSREIHADYVVVTNADNYHAPGYCDMLLTPLVSNGNLVASYCSQMAHNYWQWSMMPCSLEIAKIDCCCFMARGMEAATMGWNDIGHAADWAYISSFINEYGANRIACVDGCLVSHN